MKSRTRLSVVGLVVFTLNLPATTLYVSLQSTNPVAPYATWETAATVIQDAVDAAKDGDTVLVGDGVYATGGKTNEEGYVEARVTITNAIRLESVNGAASTTIDGSGDGQCLLCTADSVVTGFTLTGGSTSRYGGGVCGGTLRKCILRGNGSYGGRIGTGRGGGAFKSALFDCRLEDNYAFWVGGGAYSCVLYNCTVTGNSGAHDGGGGASESTLYNCTLTGNSSGWGGGASFSTLYNCTLSDNSARRGGGASYSTLYNCTLTGNSASEYGGGVFVGTLYNSIVYYNEATNGANWFTGSIPDWGDYSTLLSFCCTTPLPANGVGNITGSPLFMDMAAGDFRLREDSPCIDAGTNLLGVAFTDLWTGESRSYDQDPTDILGNTRFIDGNGDGKLAWDIGAYEFNSYPPPRFSSPPRLTSDGWKLNLTGAHNKWVHVQRSSNLKDWEEIWYDWMGATGEKQVIDGDTGQRAMFYRAVVK